MLNTFIDVTRRELICIICICVKVLFVILEKYVFER